MPNNFYVDCPNCDYLLEIDPRKRKVIQHFENKKKKSKGDLLQDQLGSMKKEAEDRDKIFSKAKEEREKKLNQLDQLFGEEAEKIKKKGKIDKPKNIFDNE